MTDTDARLDIWSPSAATRISGALDSGARVRLDRTDAIELLKSLPDGSIDVLTTDPAYNGMNQHLALGHGRIVGSYEGRGDGEAWFDEFSDDPENYAAFLTEAARALGPDKHAYFMFDAFSLLTLGSVVREHFNVKNVITWDKVAMGMGHNFRRQSEFIIFCTTGKRRLVRRDAADVWRIRRVHKGLYPTQKPIELFEAMIAASVGTSDGSEIVCDPFSGSASSMVAALRHGCSFVGGDIADSALDAAQLRLDAFTAQQVDPLQPKSVVDPAIQKPFWEESRL